MNDIQIIDLTPGNIADYGVCGYKDMSKHLELKRKIEWFNRYYPKGLRIKALITKSGGYQGMLEYIPGAYAHRPVDATGYMFIHCVFVGFKKDYKGKGFASLLLDECIMEARSANMSGVAVVARKGSFMAGRDIFLKKGFITVDKAAPDFELLALKFVSTNASPKFRPTAIEKVNTGITVYRSPQCPYTVKNVDAIINTARSMNMVARIVEVEDSDAAQQVPCAFGTFCILHDGEVISHHPISNTRFENIMKGRVGNR